MGNCLDSSGSRVPKFSIRTECSSVPSSLTIQSFNDKSNASSEILSSPNLKALTFNELKNSTRNFHLDSFLGEGRFGYVFKGWIDEYTCSAAKPGSGMAIAVKKLKSERFQGHKKWLNEVNYIGQLHHPNLVKLIGYCLEGENRLLVYEFMPKGSLENHLFKRGPQGPQSLSWEIRIKVAIGAARGLCFLHEAKPHVIYFDFKASNILLDAEFNAKISDHRPSKAAAAREYVTTGSGVPKFSIRTDRSSAPSSRAIQSFSDKSNASSEILSSPTLKALTFNELKNNTRNFHPDSFLGEGGFGYVFKGWIDEYNFSATKPGSGMAVAVKKLKSERFQGPLG